MGTYERHIGASRDRTGDLLHAMQALSQLSYSPVIAYERRDSREQAAVCQQKRLKFFYYAAMIFHQLHDGIYSSESKDLKDLVLACRIVIPVSSSC